MSDPIRAAFEAGYMAGFDNSREGWNGGCAFTHCADDPKSLIPPMCDEEEAAKIQMDAAFAEFLQEARETETP